MKTVAILLASGLATAAFASDTSPDTVRVASLQVQDQLQTIELINVTAEKQIDENAPAPDAELARILDEVEALETEDSPE